MNTAIGQSIDQEMGLFPMQTQSLHASLLYTPHPSKWMLTDQGNRPVLQQLLNHYSQVQPIAGPDYWGTRVWTLAIWQPIYLSICAAHISRHFINVTSVSQCVNNGIVMGYDLGSSAFSSVNNYSASASHLVSNIAGPLRELIDNLYDDLSALVKMNRANSYGLIADSVMHALQALMKVNPQWQHQKIITLGNSWCEQLGLINRKGQALSQLTNIQLNNKQNILTLERKACCKHYLIDPKDICNSCVRLSWQQRLQKLNTEL